MELDLLILDYLVITTLLVSAVLSLLRGFTKEVLSIASWVLAIYAALFFSPYVKPLLARYIEIDIVVNAGALLIVFVLVFIIAALIANAVADRFKKHAPGMLDHSLGVLFGLGRGALLVCLAYFAMVLAIPEAQHPDWVRDAKTRPLMQTGVKIIVAIVPLDRLPINISNIKIPASAPLSIPALVPNILLDNKPDKNSDKGYKPADRKLIERLIRNTEESK